MISRLFLSLLVLTMTTDTCGLSNDTSPVPVITTTLQNFSVSSKSEVDCNSTNTSCPVLERLSENATSTGSLNYASTNDGEQSPANPCKVTDSIISYATLIVATFGIVGNVLSIIILASLGGKVSTNILLGALAVCDIIYLTLKIILHGVPAICIDLVGVPVPTFNSHFAYVVLYGWNMVTVVYSTGTWVVVLVTLHRFIAVCLPHHASRLCRPSLAKIQLLVVVMLNIAYALPIYFDSYVETLLDGQGGWYNKRSYTWLGANWYYQYIYRTILYFLIMFGMPLLMLFVMVVMLILALRRANRRRQEMTGKNSAQEDITKILITVVLMFILSTVSNPLRRLAEALEGGRRGCGSTHYVVQFIANMMVLLNSSINFVVYMWFGQKFRQGARRICCCGRAEDEGAQRELDEDGKTASTSASSFPPSKGSRGMITAKI